ncbi:MAG: phosphatidate cytidylyltransferase [Bacteroidetes bacterium]|jgi:hypothetical protein|nr:phosphatidate cytidylyltransferase [Bacteroidota bacterium]
MKQYSLIQLCLASVFLAASLSSCEVVGGIFKAGVWVGVLIVVGIIALILYLIGKGRK